MLHDYFIATPTELDIEVSSSGPGSRFESMDGCGIDSIMLASLHSILLGESEEESIQNVSERGAKPLDLGAQQESWLFEVIPDFLDRVLSLTKKEELTVGRAWARTEEFGGMGLSDEDFAAWIGSIRRLTQRAKEQKKRVYLWTSL